MTSPILVFEKKPLSVSSSKRVNLLKKLVESDKISNLNEKEVSINEYELSFYTGIKLLEIKSPNWPKYTRLCFLSDMQNFWRLNGTSPPIHEVNATKKISITDNNVLEYLAFFCFFVRGEDGPFFIFDRIDNTFIPDLEQIDLIEDAYRPPQIWGKDADGNWRISAMVYYNNAIFNADFVVQKSGMIEMKEDRMIIKDLEEKINAPLELDLEES